LIQFESEGSLAMELSYHNPHARLM
jgi:hypothetical protein